MHSQEESLFNLSLRTSLSRIFLLFFLVSYSCFSATELIVEPDQGRTPILNKLQHAHRSIDLVIYGFTDHTFLKYLEEAKKRNVEVRILIERNPYRATNENDKIIRELKKLNIPYHFSNPNYQLTHQKTFIIDNSNAIVMTFNLTHSSFKDQRNFALITDDPNDLHEIKKVFDADWHNMPTNVYQPNLVWSPNNSREKILNLIQYATRSIDIYADNISDYQIIGALAKASRRGVKVNILTSAKNQKLPNRKTIFLQHAGVNIIFSDQYYIHAKVLIIDKRQALVGSINFTKESLDKNRELSVETRDPFVIKKLLDTFALDSNQRALEPNFHYTKNSVPYIIIKNIKRCFSGTAQPRLHKRFTKERKHSIKRKKIYV